MFDFDLPPDFGNELLQNDLEQPEQFLIIESETKGDASNPFNTGPGFYLGTEQDLKNTWEANKQVREQFGSYENYLNYNREFTESGANWIENVQMPVYRPGSDEWAIVNGEDLWWDADNKAAIEQKIREDQKNAFYSAYRQWAYGDEGSALLSKYGIEPTIRNQDGDVYRFTGTGYHKTYKVDDSFDVSGFTKGLIISVITSGLAAAAAPALASAIAANTGVSAATAEAIAKGLVTVAANGGDVSATDILSTGLSLVGVPEEIMTAQEWTDYAKDVILETVVNEIKDADFDGGDIVWQGTNADGVDAVGGIVNEDGDFVFSGADVSVTVPDYTTPQEEPDGGGGEEGGATAGGNATQGDPSTDQPTEDPATEGAQGGYVYEGNGVFRDTVDGDLWYVPDMPSDIKAGDAVTEDWMAESGATVYDGTQGDYNPETDQGSQEGETGDAIQDIIGGLLPDMIDIISGEVDPEVADEVTDDTSTNNGTNTSPTTDTPTTETPSTSTGGSSFEDFYGPNGENAWTDGGEGDGTDGGDGSGDGGTGDGTGQGDGSGSGDGTGDGDGDGTGDGSGGGMLSPSSSAYDMKWSELFPYTTIAPYQKKALAPYVDYVAKAKGMLS